MSSLMTMNNTDDDDHDDVAWNEFNTKIEYEPKDRSELISSPMEWSTQRIEQFR